MIRSVVKSCFASAYGCAIAARQLKGAHRPQPFLACYHRVVEHFERSARHAIPSLLISTAMLERHIDWMAKRFSIVSLDEVTSDLRTPGQRAGKPLAAITFDDGYSDVYQNAFPLLKRKGVPAAVFTVTDLIGTGRPQIFDRLYLSLVHLHARGASLAGTVQGVSRSMQIETSVLDRSTKDEPFRIMTLLLSALPHEQIAKIVAALETSFSYKPEILDEIAPLTWEMIREMDRGGMTIGSHTKSHALLTSENLQTARRELTESKQALEAVLKKPVSHFAYPDGRFNPAVVDIVNAAGYQSAYGICRTRDDRYPMLTVPRKVLWQRSSLNALGRFSPAIMNAHYHGAFDSDSCEHNHIANQGAGMYASVA